MEKRTVDARGLSCPQPVILTMEALKQGGACTILVDNQTSLNNVTRYIQSAGRTSTVAQNGEEYAIEVQ